MPKLGYLLPTCERIMEGRDGTGSLLALRRCRCRGHMCLRLAGEPEMRREFG